VGLKHVCLLDLESATVRALSTLLGRNYYVLVAKLADYSLSVLHSVLHSQARLDALVVGVETQDLEKLELFEALEAERQDLFLAFLCLPDTYTFLHQTSKLKVQRFFENPLDILKLTESIHEEFDLPRERSGASSIAIRYRAVACAIKYVKENLVDIKHSTDVSRRVGVSREYLSREFTRCTGHTLWGFVSNCRVERAKEQLKLDQSLIKQISGEVGFNSLSAFYRAFKKYVKVTPEQYRESLAQR
jgi:AraC-like DNA-binding protein